MFYKNSTFDILKNKGYISCKRVSTSTYNEWINKNPEKKLYQLPVFMYENDRLEIFYSLDIYEEIKALFDIFDEDNEFKYTLFRLLRYYDFEKVKKDEDKAYQLDIDGILKIY